MLHFRNRGLSSRGRGKVLRRVAGALALAGAVALVAGGPSEQLVSAQSPAPAQAGVQLQSAQIGYATTDQLMAIEAREAQSASAGLTAGGPVSERRRRIVRRPSFEAQRIAGTQAAVTATEPELTASEAVTLQQSFITAALSETNAFPPDPSGAAGPSQFILAANGRIRSFSKTTGVADLVLNLSTNAFFTPVRNSPNAFGPKVKYDRLAGRWFIIAATDSVPGRIVIASSNASTITATTLWSFFSFDNNGFPGSATCAVDSPTFGLDPYALYIGVVQFCDPGGVYMGTSGFVVRKTSVIDFATIVVTAFHNLTGSSAGPGPFAPQGVDNEDANIATGFFIGVDNASLGTLMLRRVSNPGGTPTISGNVSIAVSPTAVPITVRHLGNLGSTDGQLDGGDDRLSSAMLQNGSLWTAHTIGVTDTGVASGSATRNGIRWYQIGSLTGTPAVQQSGTLFTPGSPGNVNQRNYWVPSIATSTSGRTIIGYSAAGTSEFVNGGVAERYSSDTANTLRAPQLFTSSPAAYNPPNDPGSPTRGRRWGGVSSTVVDGCDGSTIWTLQQFTDSANSYALAAGRTVGPGAPTPTSVTPSVIPSGVASINLQVTATSSGGTAFFDPGPGYLCHMGASIPGVTVNSVTRTGPTTVTINVSTVGAAPGLKPISVVNPDAQGATSGAILRVVPGPLVVIDAPVAGSVGQPVTVRGWAVDGNAASGTGVDAVHVYATPAGGGAIFVGAATYGQARADVGAAHGSRFTNSGYTLTAASALAPGAYTITAYAHSTATGTFNVSTSVTVTLLGPTAPFGSLDTPAEGATVTGEMGVTGWALDDVAGTRVEIYRSAVAGEPGGIVYIGRAGFIRGARPDVQAAYPNAADNDSAGWGLMVLTNFLPNQGNGAFTFYAYAIDGAGLQTLLGTRRIVAANASSTKPFGTIDTPAQGETVSGTIINFGWALTPQPNIIPTNGSTINVYVDGVLRGHPTYNQNRTDIATLFPGLRNSTGAVGFISIDTTTLSNGLHTIEWIVTDSAGQATGIGSRFFRVQNGS